MGSKPRIRDFEPQRLVGKALLETFHQNVNDTAEVFLRQGLEHDDLVETVQEFRTERAAQLAHDGGAGVFRNAAVRLDTVEQLGGAEIRCQDDDRILKVHRAAL